MTSVQDCNEILHGRVILDSFCKTFTRELMTGRNKADHLHVLCDKYFCIYAKAPPTPHDHKWVMQTVLITECKQHMLCCDKYLPSNNI